MNRRKPQIRFAVVPIEDGMDERTAVLRKAAGAAFSSCAEQVDGFEALPGFIAGYAAGFARHQALKHGVDVEEDMTRFLAVLAAAAPEDLCQPLSALVFAVRAAGGPRATLGIVDELADAGYLTGHLEARCGSRKLLSTALDAWGKPDAVLRYLTACDIAADRMQTHEPTASLRFDQAERVVIAAAFSPSAG